MNADSPDPATVALSSVVERAVRRVDRLDTLLAQLAAEVTQLGQALSATPNGGPSAVRAWLLCEDPDRAITDLTDLIIWLGRIYLQYSDATLPSCWLWHADVIEELWWLRQAHADAYDPQRGSWQRVADWHDRQRPNVVRRIQKAAGMCELLLHAQGREIATPPRNVPLATAGVQIAVAWATTGRHQAPPTPTAEQLATADRHDRPAHGNER